MTDGQSAVIVGRGERSTGCPGRVGVRQGSPASRASRTTTTGSVTGGSNVRSARARRGAPSRARLVGSSSAWRRRRRRRSSPPSAIQPAMRSLLHGGGRPVERSTTARRRRPRAARHDHPAELRPGHEQRVESAEQRDPPDREAALEHGDAGPESRSKDVRSSSTRTTPAAAWSGGPRDGDVERRGAAPSGDGAELGSIGSSRPITGIRSAPPSASSAATSAAIRTRGPLPTTIRRGRCASREPRPGRRSGRPGGRPSRPAGARRRATPAPGGSESELPGRRREASRHAVSGSGAGPQVEPRARGCPPRRASGARSGRWAGDRVDPAQPSCRTRPGRRDSPRPSAAHRRSRS